MAIVWETTMTVAGNAGGAGYIESVQGSIADAGADMYSNATCRRLFYSVSGELQIRFAGNVSGGWQSCKLGFLIFDYSEFTRTYDGSNTEFTLFPESSPLRYITPAPDTPMRIVFYDQPKSEITEYGLQIFGDTKGDGVTWSNQTRYTNVLRSGSTSVPAGGQAGPFTATGVGGPGATLLILTQGAFGDEITYTTTTNSFTLFNSGTLSITVDYLALRT